jgi:hypothetical protein
MHEWLWLHHPERGLPLKIQHPSTTTSTLFQWTKDSCEFNKYGVHAELGAGNLSEVSLQERLSGLLCLPAFTHHYSSLWESLTDGRPWDHGDRLLCCLVNMVAILNFNEVSSSASIPQLSPSAMMLPVSEFGTGWLDVEAKGDVVGLYP